MTIFGLTPTVLRTIIGETETSTAINNDGTFSRDQEYIHYHIEKLQSNE